MRFYTGKNGDLSWVESRIGGPLFFFPTRINIDFDDQNRRLSWWKRLFMGAGKMV